MKLDATKARTPSIFKSIFSECPKLYADCWFYIYLDCDYTKAFQMAITKKLNLFNLNNTD